MAKKMAPTLVAQHLRRPGIEPTTPTGGNLRSAQVDGAKTTDVLEYAHIDLS